MKQPRAIVTDSTTSTSFQVRADLLLVDLVEEDVDAHLGLVGAPLVEHLTVFLVSVAISTQSSGLLNLTCFQSHASDFTLAGRSKVCV